MLNFSQSSSKKENIVTRFAPSPTGFLHIGGVRTALFSYLFARHSNGKYILRIEDTDKERNKEEWADGLVDDLKWLGLVHDELYIQSKNLERHQELLHLLIEEGKAYVSKEEAKDGSGVIKDIIRFKNPNKKISFNDLIRGEIVTDTTDLGDFVIARNINEPLYHFAVIIDDHDEGVTHVVRAEEHVSNTPRQLLLIEAFGWSAPLYAHLPLVLATDKSKLSKRKHGETVSLTYYREQGYLPEAIINFVAFIGWNPGDEREIFSLAELVEVFDISKAQKGGAVFNVEKLNWYNKYYLGKLSTDQQREYVARFVSTELSTSPCFEKLIPIIMERISSGSEIRESELQGEYAYYLSDIEYEKEKLIWKQSNTEDTLLNLKQMSQLIESSDSNAFSAESFKALVWPHAEAKGKGHVLWPIRSALSCGKDKSPDPFIMAGILGYKKTLERIQKAIQLLSS
jgi:glutamyl-tRNA synthetase